MIFGEWVSPAASAAREAGPLVVVVALLLLLAWLVVRAYSSDTE